METHRTIHRRGRRTDGNPHDDSFVDSDAFENGQSHQYRHPDVDADSDKNANSHAHAAAYFYPITLALPNSTGTR